MKDKKYLIKQDMIDVMKNYIVSSDYNIPLYVGSFGTLNDEYYPYKG